MLPASQATRSIPSQRPSSSDTWSNPYPRIPVPDRSVPWPRSHKVSFDYVRNPTHRELDLPPPLLGRGLCCSADVTIGRVISKVVVGLVEPAAGERMTGVREWRRRIWIVNAGWRQIDELGPGREAFSRSQARRRAHPGLASDRCRGRRERSQHPRHQPVSTAAVASACAALKARTAAIAGPIACSWLRMRENDGNRGRTGTRAFS